jgi:hypothetical protein
MYTGDNTMNPEADSRKPLIRTLGDLCADASPSRRKLMSQLSAVAMGVMLSGAFTGTASAKRPHTRPPRIGTVESLPDGLRVLLRDFQIEIRQIGTDQISLDAAPADEPENPVYTSTHSGVLTPELIDQITAFVEQLTPAQIARIRIAIRTLGIGGNDIVVMIVLFILLIIVGAG